MHIPPNTHKHTHTHSHTNMRMGLCAHTHKHKYMKVTITYLTLFTLTCFGANSEKQVRTNMKKDLFFIPLTLSAKRMIINQ